MKLESLYRALPPFAQNLACSAYGLRERRVRMGRHFWPRYRWLLQSEAASREEIASYQNEQVATLVAHAYRTVPYYRRVMDERALNPSDIQSVADLRRLPVLTKEDVIRNRDALISHTPHARGLRPTNTSGTTGTTLQFFLTPEAIAFKWAVWWRHRARFGVRPLTWHLNFTGRPVVPASQRRPPYWRWNVPMRQALVSMQHVTRERAPALARFIDSHSFEYFTGYPSIIHSFAALLEDLGINLSSRPNHVFLGAENVQDYQREAIQRVLGARVTDQYGFSEGCGNASRCESGPYHEDWEFGVLECLTTDEASDGSSRGAIAATGFADWGFPLIRYQVGDHAVWEPPTYRCACGRHSRVIRAIEGRDEDFVITPEGAQIRRFDYVFKGTDGIKEAQVVQSELGSVSVRYVPRSSPSKADEDKVRDSIRTYISPSIEVRFEPVTEIPRGPSGKFRPVVSTLNLRANSESTRPPQQGAGA